MNEQPGAPEQFGSRLDEETVEEKKELLAKIGSDSISEAPSARKFDASPSRPLFPLGGLMEQSNASLQRGRQG